jgi:hypothetical protein
MLWRKISHFKTAMEARSIFYTTENINLNTNLFASSFNHKYWRLFEMGIVYDSNAHISKWWKNMYPWIWL